MSDPRCTCKGPTCPICTAPAHQPWTPRPGNPLLLDNMSASLQAAEERAARLQQHIDLDTTQWQRRLVLAFLLAFLGGMIGGMASALTIIALN